MAFISRDTFRYLLKDPSDMRHSQRPPFLQIRAAKSMFGQISVSTMRITSGMSFKRYLLITHERSKEWEDKVHFGHPAGYILPVAVVEDRKIKTPATAS